MKIKKSIQLVYTKEALTNLVIGNAADAGFSVKATDVIFQNKRSRKSDFKSIVITQAEEILRDVEKKED